ncbi:uncharacterized protein LOC109711876 isoform X3 [Ananas comosus]|uniref:Uncharacterized protein LOC109711876 isoform X3 n=1 Tax=Ananas comosus TaxID=4615 RepID=A0A6P5F3T4_ANACO|nr:uncharacterized protein LOC109711876 isoform X3 [Ananas comosus]
MGPGEEEKGEIFFFYRPKVNKEEAQGPDDVQRIYIVLRPQSGKQPVEEKQASESGKEGRKKGRSIKEGSGKQPVEEKQASEPGKEGRKKGQSKEGGRNNDTVEGGRGTEEVDIEKQPLLRLIVMGKKRLPNPSERSRPFWGFVELVTTNVDDIKTALKGEEYDTATRGRRHRPPARALAEGVYRILRHVPSGRQGRQEHTHLIYKLELPPSGSEGEPQESFNVEREASFLIQIKNPEVGRGDGSDIGGGFRGLQTKRKAAFPARLQGQFGGKRFIPADPPDFLNYEGCELLLISASDDIEEELGLELKTECEADADCSDLLQMFGEAAATKPLLSGTWV